MVSLICFVTRSFHASEASLLLTEKSYASPLQLAEQFSRAPVDLSLLRGGSGLIALRKLPRLTLDGCAP
jgi:hypothetical protein